jgi:hypothetical protein
MFLGILGWLRWQQVAGGESRYKKIKKILIVKANLPWGGLIFLKIILKICPL